MVNYQGKHVGRRERRKRGWLLCACLGVLLAGLLVLFLVNPKLELLSSVTVEAGSEIPSAQAFLPQGTDMDIAYGSDISDIDSRVPGKYPVTLLAEGNTYRASILIVDTVAPQGTTRNLSAYQENIPTAEEFLVDIQDVTDVTVRFQEEPDRNHPGDQTVTLILTDTSGNTSEVCAVLTVITDQEPPEIEGVQDIEVYQGETVAYRTGITVTDNLDPLPELTVDSSQVDLTLPGVYEVVYTATDSTGNKTEIIANVTVLEKKETYVPLEQIYEEADRILSGIMEENMTDEEQVEAVYYYIRKNYGYINTSDKSDWRQAAYKMMENRSGDCFSYFSLFKLFMERLEIPNIDVVKVKNYQGDSSHYWSLVSVDGGETYYHVDVTPRNDLTQFLLVTDAFLDQYSAKHYNCFNRDKSLYPATP